jgi:dephospho-CoA kinase
MLRVGLTGGLCCGKTTVGKMFAELGCPVLDADAIGHQALAEEPAHSEVLREFGSEVADKPGTIDRARLAGIVFRDPERLQRLNAILHPRILDRIASELDRLEAQRHAVAVVEAALMVEAGVERQFDRLIVVTCGDDQKIRRFQMRAGATHDQAVARIAAQMPDEQKARVADFVIDNSGPLDATRHQVENVFAVLRHDASAETS